MTAPVNTSTLKVGNATLPVEGPRCLTYQLDFSLAGSYTLSVSDILSRGPGFPGLSVIQGFWIDNSQSSAPLLATLTGTGQIIRAAPGTQGYYPVLSPSIGQILIISAGGLVVNFDIYNVPLPAVVWASTGFQFVTGGPASGALKTSDVILDAMVDASKGLKVYEAISTVLTGSNVTVTSGAAVHLITAGSQYGGIITNIDTTITAYISNTNAVSSSNYPLLPGNSFNLDAYGGNVWAIAASGSINVGVAVFS